MSKFEDITALLCLLVVLEEICQVILSVCWVYVAWLKQAGRVGSHFHWQETNAHPFLRACSRRSLRALRVEWEKWEDVTFPKAAEVRWPISHHTHGTKRERERERVIDCQWFWFWLRGVSGRPHDRCKANKMKWNYVWTSINVELKFMPRHTKN